MAQGTETNEWHVDRNTTFGDDESFANDGHRIALIDCGGWTMLLLRVPIQRQTLNVRIT